MKVKKYVSILMAVLLCVASAAGVTAEAADFGGVFPDIAGENGTTYVSLFDVIISDQWTPVWQDYIAAVAGEEAAPEMTARLQSSITSDLYGEEAAEAFADGGYAFDCDFINGAQSITFKDDTATILKTDGSSETHTYEYLGQYNVGETETMMYQGTEISMAFPVDVYRSTDEAGEFNYFFLREDTMAETYHIEFRYGRDLEELQGYLVGPYAYWLAAGIDESADEETIQKVIALFCLENMDYSAHAASPLAQLADLGFIGAWKADMSPFGEENAATELTMTIDENGHGVTLMNGEQTADFEAYAVDNGEKGDGEGLYVAWSNLEYEAEAAPYSMTVNGDGQTVLTLTADDGIISWIKQTDAAEPAGVTEIATAEELLAVSSNLSGSYVLTADIDLAGIEWTPVGAFQPLSDAPEDAEVPHPDYAFTGSFNGNGHKISNLTVTNAAPMGAGLFGCACGTERGEAYIGNFTLENVNVSGGYLVGGAVGLQFTGCKVSDIALVGDNKLTGMQGIGGIVGTGFDLISNCSATADIIVTGNDGACAGLIAGGTTMSSIENCQALGGSITAEGDDTWAFGAVCGAPWGAPEIRDCTASDTLIRVSGTGNRLVGGLLGFAGTYDPEKPAQIIGCKVENVTIEVSDSTDSVGGLIGAGKEMMEGSHVMSSFEISDCVVSGTITGGGEHVDAVVGDPACAVNIACEGGMAVK